MNARVVIGIGWALAVACAEESSQTLGGADAHAVDVGLDAAVGDADSGPVEVGPDAGGGGECVDNPLWATLTLTEADGTERPLEAFEQGATVIEVAPLVFALRDGRRLTLTVSPDPGDVPLRVGARLNAALEVYRPFWTEFRLTLTDRESGALRAAVWDGSSYASGPLGGVAVDHADHDCRREDDCGVTVGRTLLVEPGVALPPGGAVTFKQADGVRTLFFNGRSERYVEGPFCTDTPSDWYQGYILRFEPTDDCDAVGRDACIASPDCALHGSIDRDPGYACFEASTTCERFDVIGCVALPDLCVWDTGDCYCPESMDCFCGDGPPPVCRRRCNPLTDEVSCANEYFCEAGLGIGGSICLLDYDAGHCVREPASCEGTPASAPTVCACPEVSTNGLPVFYENDCVRRQRHGVSAPLDLCRR